MSSVSVRNVSKFYGDRPILTNISLDVADGEFISIIGASGCGKSTFLRMLLAQEQPSSGNISIGGAPPAEEPDRNRGIVYQRYSVFPHMTARDNLIAAEGFAASPWTGRLWGKARRAAAERADRILERVGLGHVGDHYPAALSGGMQQRLAIAQALIGPPRLLLLDEPFGALDPGTRLSMHDFLDDLRADFGITVFMVTHDLAEAFKLGDRVIVFDKPSRDLQDPNAHGAVITYDLDARNGGVPYQASSLFSHSTED